ncbi:uncharacterized protein BO87DRAFT_299297 [Aspergillus neoniger CBS 115656]|uniref:Choline monooxygenase, chloroplastic n=1 Tax=Aspergillus neoniger (strain CBS 115656) TaxID=1448310 RepID=A0A318YV56_ASPNB|nr:hypothetical protein BO87DRAFT_299297 [Aspergillus neoniger CBS 115656]PYH38356.1 hypothetical protein BO87DRAFT_299297 [Aspergillus neoniger CBS 115656]
MSELMRTLPASWYCSPPLYQLERRAVFLKSWYLVGPVTRFCDIGAKERPLKHHVTPTGLVFATLSDEAPSFHEYFPDLEPLLQRVNFTKLPYRHSIKYEGRFNWKTMYLIPLPRIRKHIADPEKPDDGLFLYFFPNCTLNVYGGGMSSFRVCPTDDPNVTRMEFDYYHMESGEKFDEYFKFVRQVAMEDYELCEKAQNNLTKGIYSEGILNPEKESGVSCEHGGQHSFIMAIEEPYPALPPALSALVLVLLLAGLAFLLQSLSKPLFRGYKSLRVAKPTETELDPVPEGNENIVCKESDFPHDWWTGSEVFELERRAIVSKRWLYLVHRNRFTKPGDYHSFEVAGIPIFLVLGKDGVVRAFHNVCRHRAYTVTRKECGSSMILGCRYHGWSYNTKGQLIKAPHFDNVPGFDKAQNSLFSIHITTTPAGFIFVNLDASPTIMPLQTRSLDFFAGRHGIGRQSTWLGGQTVEGQFNWKIGCKFINHTELETEFSQPRYKALLLSLFNSSPMRSEDVRVFPFTTIHTVRGGVLWYSLSFIPISKSSTSVRIDLYTHKAMGSPTPSPTAERLFNKLSNSIRELETQFESLSETVAYVIPTQPNPSFKHQSYQQRPDTQLKILEAIKSHAKVEKQLGTEIFPATRRPRTNARFEQAEQSQLSLFYTTSFTVLLK